jgi:hypothetical protein
MYKGSDIAKNINQYRKDEKKLKNKLNHYKICNNKSDEDALEKVL